MHRRSHDVAGPAPHQYASMQVFRAATGRYAVMVLECDSHIPHALEQQLAVMPGLLKVTCLNVDEPEGTEE